MTEEKSDDFKRQMALLKVNEILARIIKMNPGYKPHSSKKTI